MKIANNRFRIAVLISSLFIGGQLWADCSAQATIGTMKSQYVKGEPVSLLFMLKNSGAGDIKVEVSYPDVRGGAGADSLIFTNLDAGAGGRNSQRDVHPSSMGMGNQGMEVTVASGQSWSIPIYLQDFIEAPAVGVTTIQYHASLPCRDRSGKPTEVPLRGNFKIHIIQATQAELDSAIDALAETLRKVDSSMDHSVAAEGLALADSEHALDFAKLMLDAGQGMSAVRLLARFPNSPKAQQIVTAVLAGPNSYHIQSAFAVLRRWKHQIPLADFEKALKHPEPIVRMSALEYAEALGKKQYLPGVKTVLSDRDESVRAYAKRAFNTLQGAKD